MTGEFLLREFKGLIFRGENTRPFLHSRTEYDVRRTEAIQSDYLAFGASPSADLIRLRAPRDLDPAIVVDSAAPRQRIARRLGDRDTPADPCIRDAEGFHPYSIATEGAPIHRALDRAGGHDLACQGQGETAALGSDELRRIQEALAGAGFDPGPADRELGPRTRRAIEGWQQANGYAATGELTDAQVEALLADAPLEPFGPSWIVAENQPCQLWNPYPEPGETVAWTGPCVDGKASGEGRYVWRRSDGVDTYEGSMRDGERHSHGTVTWVDGERYEGDWRAGNQHGLGTYTWADGRAKTCEWRDHESVDGTCEFH